MLLHHSKGGEASILPLRRIDGKDSFIDAELLQKKTWINEIAKEFIKLEKLSYNAIGCLAFESEDKPDLYVGPMVEPTLCGRDKQGRLSQLGPFEMHKTFVSLRFSKCSPRLKAASSIHKMRLMAISSVLKSLI